MTQQFIIIAIGIVVILLIALRMYNRWINPNRCAGCDHCAPKGGRTMRRHGGMSARRRGDVCRVMLPLIGVLLTSCVTYETDDEVNSWIYKQMKTHYLYASSIPSSVNMAQSPEAFFNGLLSDKEKRNSNYFFSHIEEKKSRTRAAVDAMDGYGMEVKFLLDAPSNMIMAIVEYVQPGSPAERAKLQRGDIIYMIDGVAVSANNAGLLFSGGTRRLTRGYELPVGTMNFRDEITLPPSELLSENPILMQKIVEIDGSKVGYLVYLSFATGPNGFDDKTYEHEFISAIQKMKDSGVKDFVLDLRFNRGGFVDECAMVASCFVPSVQLGKLFGYTKTNAKLNKRNDYPFSTNEAVRRANLNLSRMVVITSPKTASASELLIHGLRPYCNVIQVGSTTEGKNIGSYELSDKRHAWVMSPITVQVYNSQNSSSSDKGLKPSGANFCEEDRMVDILPLGEANEHLLSRALKALGYNPSVRGKACINEENSVPLQRLNISRPRLGGCIVTIVPEGFEEM